MCLPLALQLGKSTMGNSLRGTSSRPEKPELQNPALRSEPSPLEPIFSQKDLREISNKIKWLHLPHSALDLSRVPFQSDSLVMHNKLAFKNKIQKLALSSSSQGKRRFFECLNPDSFTQGCAPTPPHTPSPSGGTRWYKVCIF